MTPTEATQKKAHFPLLRYFAVAGAVAFIAATSVLAYLWELESIDRSIALAERQNVHLAETMMNALRGWGAGIPKGTTDQYNILSLVQAIKRVGLSTFVFKSDQEFPLCELKRRVAERLGAGCHVEFENSPVESHQSNGVVERAIWDVAGTARTLKLQADEAYGRKIETSHCCIPWLIKYSGVLVTLFAIGVDGN